MRTALLFGLLAAKVAGYSLAPRLSRHSFSGGGSGERDRERGFFARKKLFFNGKRTKTICFLPLPGLVLATIASAQVLPLPPRATNAPAGNAFAQQIISSQGWERDREIQAQILAGNVPESLRHLVPVTVSSASGGRTNSLTFYVTPDYLGIGTDDDFFRAPMMPATAQRIADELHCTMPTRKMADAIYSQAKVKLVPQPIPPSAAMTTVPVFLAHNEIVHTQLVALAAPPAALVAGHQKDVVISARLADSPGKVAIYGWHRINGAAIQPLYLGHSESWVDYSHGIRLIANNVFLNGTNTTAAQVLADPELCNLLSDEGVVTSPRYDTNPVVFIPTGHFGERTADFVIDPDVRVQINDPQPSNFASNKPVLLIFYALPNGNTIEQTVGRLPKPGDDWHFDIQHIGAQTRLLRSFDTNKTIVVALLEAKSRSWPAWRKQYGDAGIPGIVARVEGLVSHDEKTHRGKILRLSGHSGGGSFIFGYLNSVEKIPDDIERIAFLDSDYAYDPARGHADKLTAWLQSSEQHFLCVLAYNDAIARLDGKPFVSAEGGTWGRSHAMLRDLAAHFDFTSETNSFGLERHSALSGRIEFLLHENPDRKILHTVQVERNGFVHAMLTGTLEENRGYEYFGARAYTNWISP